MHSAPVDVASLLKDGIPDWDRISFDVCCARCGYNLRMLTAPRCPECGLEFAWPAALDQTEWHSGLLFEYHWSDRLLASWWNSLWRAMRPRRFWANVSLHDRIRRRPLWALILLAILFYVAVVGAIAELPSIMSELLLPRGFVAGPGWVRSPASSSVEMLRLAPRGMRSGFRPSSLTLHLAWANAVIIVATIGLLGTLRQSLGRCRARVAHVLRVAAYSATPVCFWWAAIVLGAFAFVEFGPAGLTATPSISDWLLLAGTALYLGVWAYYLAVGLRMYLRLSRASLVAVVCAFVALLACITLYAVLSSSFRRQ